MTHAQRLAMIRAAHRRHLRRERLATYYAVGAGEGEAPDVPCVIGRADVAQEIAPVTVATREAWGVL